MWPWLRRLMGSIFPAPRCSQVLLQKKVLAPSNAAESTSTEKATVAIGTEERKKKTPSSLRTFVEEADLGDDAEAAQSYQTPNMAQ